MNDRIPDRVTAELNQHLRLQEKAEARKFDPWDDGLFKDLFGNLAPSLQDLLLRLEQIEKTDQSFGADKQKSFDFILPALYRLREACKEEFDRL